MLVERGAYPVKVEEIRELPSVVDRLAAAGPSKVRGPHCWFCGKIEAWFLCDCPEARDAQQGKRAKPRFDAKLGAMILDEEIIERNLAWGFGRRYVAAAKPSVDKSVDSVDKFSRVDTSSVDKSTSVDSAVDKAAGQRAYKAENERQRRAKQKGQP